jgi:phosphoadenosine phosphosulfate reductase
MRAEECIGCGVCIGRCPEGAIVLEGEPPRAVIIADKCSHCGKCNKKCPVTDFQGQFDF